MSKEITFHKEQEGYGEWNEKIVGKAKQFCVICYDALDVLYKNGKAVWTKGQNAEPLNKGRCCNYCNDTKVIPARIKSIAGIKPVKVTNDDVLDLHEMQEMMESLISLRTKQEKEKK